MKAPRTSTQIPCPLREAARTHPSAPAVISPARTLTYAELDGTVTATAERLRPAVEAAEGRVALHLANRWAYIVLLLALIRAGGTAYLLSTRLPAAGVREHLKRMACRHLLTDQEVDETEAPWVRRPGDVLVEPAPSLQDRPPVSIPARHPVTVVFTSGSTGPPKAVLHAFGNHYYNALGSNQNIRLAPGDRWLLALPLYHVGGLGILFRCLLAGATVVMPPPNEALHETLSTYHITHASLVATQLYRLLQDEVFRFDMLKAILLGGSAIPEALIGEARRRGLPVHTTYGLTEMASQVTTTPPGAAPWMLHSSGRVLPYRDLRIADDGEILVKGATLFLGYLDQGHLARPVDAEGWFHTRDLGRLGEDGFLYVQGRKDLMFISGGENIQPEDIERALCRIDGVERAVVVPVPDAEFGARPVAFVQGPAVERTADVVEQLGAQMPRFMIPRTFLPWPEGPEGMKVDRERLRIEAEGLLDEGYGL